MISLEDVFNDALLVAQKLQHLRGLIDAGGDISSIPDEEGALDAADRLSTFLGGVPINKWRQASLLPGAKDRLPTLRYLITRKGRKDTSQTFSNFDKARRQALAWTSRWAFSAGSEAEVYKLIGVTTPKMPAEVLADYVHVGQEE